MHRLFIAFPLLASDLLNELLDSVRQQVHHERISWVRPENMHLSLKFLGDTPSYKIAEIIEVLARISKQYQAFQLDFNQIGSFGSRNNPRVLWLGCDEFPNQLPQMVKDVMQQLEQLGFEADERAFVPHLTLARIKYLQDPSNFQRIIRQIPKQSYLKQAIDSFSLYESFLQKSGPIYKVIHEFPLGKE